MEIIEVEKFLKESKVSLEDYFLNLTKEEMAKVISYNKKQDKKKRKFDKKEIAKQKKKEPLDKK